MKIEKGSIIYSKCNASSLDQNFTVTCTAINWKKADAAVLVSYDTNYLRKIETSNISTRQGLLLK